MVKAENKNKVVFVAMSGGVDSSVAAWLLRQQGFEVVGVFMKNWTEKVPGLIYCPWEEDQREARMAAAKIGIPLYTWDFEKDYKQIVFNYFIDGYKKGETPNPDVICNKEIKFGLFLKKARKLGADFIATGHYVKLSETSPKTIGRSRLPASRDGLRSRLAVASDANRARQNSEGLFSEKFRQFYLSAAKDLNKDQSYFLWTLEQNQLKYCLFPLGNLTKPEVRQIAQKARLPNAKRKDSQGLCFVGKVKLKDFLKPYLPEKQGKIVKVEFIKGKRQEKILGNHNGSHLFTFGQRSGIGVGDKQALYVCGKDFKKNIVFVCFKKDLPKFFPKEVFLKNVSWINPILKFPFECQARYRYRQPLQKVRVEKGKDRKLKVIFKKLAVGVTPGQSVVFYKNRQLLGGGVIK